MATRLNKETPYIRLMYDIPYFKENDKAVVFAFMQKHPFVLLCGSDTEGQPVATQVPLFVEERNDKLFLTGHIMRKTDHEEAFRQNNKVLAVFTGPHTHVSASWYDNTKVASTWNYMSVYAKGAIRFLGIDELREVLHKTTNHFEGDPHSPANFEHLPTDYVERHMKAIVAFEIEVTGLDNVCKLSQNHDEKDYHSIVQNLEAGDSDAQKIAKEMEQRTSQLFNEK